MICKEETGDDVMVVKEIKQELCPTMKLPPHLTCSVCACLLREPVLLPCCKTALCKLCAFVKLERHTECWFGFCPKSSPLSKEGLKVSAELAIQVDLWRIQKKEQFKESSMDTEMKDEKIDGAKFVAKSEYLEEDIQCAKKEGVRYKVIQGKIMCAATRVSSDHSSSTEANKAAPVPILSPKKQLQTNEHCLQVKTFSSRPNLPMKMKGDKKQMQPNEDCLEVKHYSGRLNLPMKMKEKKQLETNEDCFVVETYSVRPNLSMKRKEEQKQLQTHEDCLEVKNYSIRTNLPMKRKEEKHSQRNKDCLEVQNYSVRPKLSMKIKEKILQTNEKCLKTENDLARLTPPIIDLVEIKEETSVSPVKIARWVNVCGNEGEEAIDIATEHDGTILLSSVRSQFPGTTGLKYRNPETNNFCGIRCHREILFAPSYEGWSGLKFVCVRPNIESNKQKKRIPKQTVYCPLKRKAEDEGQMTKKNIKNDEEKTSTLIIRGFPQGIPDTYVNQYFKRFGEVISIKVKRKPIGIAYIRFAKKEVEEKVMSQKHMFHGRWYDVQVSDIKDDINHGENVVILGLPLKIPEDALKKHFDKFGEVLKVWLKNHTNCGEFWGYAFVQFAKKAVFDRVMLQRHRIADHWCYAVQAAEIKQTDSNSTDNESERTIYVGKLTKALSAEDLRDHFETFGRVADVHISKPRTFAFVKFKDSKVAMDLQHFGDHAIKGVCVTIRKYQRRHL